MRKKIIKNIGWLFFDKIFRILGALLVGIWVARYLGPQIFGQLNYAIAFVALFSFLPDLGFHHILVRELKKRQPEIDTLLGTALVLKLAGGVFALLIIATVVFSLGMDGPGSGMLVIIIAAGFIFQSLDVIDYFYQSQVLSKYVVIARNSAFVVSSLFKIFLIINQFSVAWFAFAAALDLFLAGVFLVITYHHGGGIPRNWRFDRLLAVELLRSSWPLMFSVLLISMHVRIDQIMLGQILRAEDVGLYSVAVELSRFWYFIPALIVNTLMPYFVSLRELDNRLYLARLNQLYSLMFWMGVGVGILVLLFGELAVKIIFGPAYAESYTALLFNIWAGIFIAQAVARGIWLISENLQKYRLYNNVLAVLVNIGGNLILIPRFGIAGAAIATLISQFLGTWIFSLFWKPLRESTLNLIKASNPLRMRSPRKHPA
jgi:O-antigen/teichoic acid export membrane protein